MSYNVKTRQELRNLVEEKKLTTKEKPLNLSQISKLFCCETGIEHKNLINCFYIFNKENNIFLITTKIKSKYIKKLLKKSPEDIINFLKQNSSELIYHSYKFDNYNFHFGFNVSNDRKDNCSEDLDKIIKKDDYSWIHLRENGIKILET